MSDGTPTQQGPMNGAGDDTVVGATRRVLGCMQRAAEANLKLAAERDDEEAVWCALDTKLRPDLYRDSDETAADRAEEMHREADAREDARHTWLATPSDASDEAGATKMAEVAGTGACTTMGEVVQKKRQADKDDEDAAARKVVDDREALVEGVTNSFTVDDIKALATAAAGESHGACGLEQEEELALVAATDIPTPAGANDGGVGLLASTTARGEAEKCVDQTKQSDNNSTDEKARTETTGSEQHQAEERRRLVETVKKVLPRFLVAEEETPLGRDMTRSLAMLQEVALRLETGQRNVFSGLNPQSALAMVRSRWQPTTTAEPTAAEHSAAPATIAAAVEREEGKGATVGGAAGGCKRKEQKAFIEAAATAPPEGAAGAASSVYAGCIKTNDADNKQRAEVETRSTSELEPRRLTGDSGDGGSVVNSGGGSMTSQTPRKLEKVFGSWEEVHPAALGISSQEAAYSSVEGSEAHPASFRSMSSKGTPTLNSSATFFTPRR